MRSPSPRLIVESWDPAYGTPVAPEEDLAPSEGSVDTSVESRAWAPVPGEDDGVDVVAFVDGVRRIDARLAIPRPGESPVPGIAGSYAVGAVTWDRVAGRSSITETRRSRLAVFSGGQSAVVPASGPVSYDVESEPSTDPSKLISRFHGAMRRAEADLTFDLAHQGTFVVADGPVNDTRAHEVVGYIKTHRVMYLQGPEVGVVGDLRPGERSPLFVLGADTSFARFSWYQRLPHSGERHAWSGIVRCETPGALGVDAAVRLANRVAVLLPVVAAPAHTDPRAPQNLVPIGALERHLRHELGDARLVYRALVQAVEGAA